MTRIDADEDEVSKFRLETGDFLFNTRNSRELVGKTCVFESPPNDIVLYNNNILRVRFPVGVTAEFMDIWFRSPDGRAELNKLKSNTTNVCAIYQGKFFGFPCPVPPSNEQHRIVAKVDELTVLCDQLEQSLTEADNTRSRLLDALIHEALVACTG